MAQPTPPPPPEPQSPCPLCGHPTPEGTLHAGIARLVARQDEVLQELRKPERKSWWETTPIVIAVMAFLFTTLYQVNEYADRRAEEKRAEAAQRLELMSKFFPHLFSRDAAAQRGAIVVLDQLGDSALAATAVLVAPSEAARTALREVRMRPISSTSVGYVDSVLQRVPVIRSPAATAPDTLLTDTSAAP